MVGSVVGMQQIIITAGFLGVMVALLIVVKNKRWRAETKPASG